jgi:hypothetical protein
MKNWKTNKHLALIHKWLAELEYYQKVRKPIDEQAETLENQKKAQRRLDIGKAGSKKWYLKNRERQLEYYRQYHKKRKLCKKK